MKFTRWFLISANQFTTSATTSRARVQLCIQRVAESPDARWRTEELRPSKWRRPCQIAWLSLPYTLGMTSNAPRIARCCCSENRSFISEIMESNNDEWDSKGSSLEFFTETWWFSRCAWRPTLRGRVTVFRHRRRVYLLCTVGLFVETCCLNKM